MRALRIAAVAAIVSAGSLVAFAGSAHAATIVRPGQSIQAAIDAAGNGGTIILQPGTYNENLQITTDDITIIGNGATLTPPASPVTTGCMNAFGDNGTPGPADGICIIGQVDMAAMQVSTPVRDPRIIGLHITGFPGMGIATLGAENARYMSNVLTDNGSYGAAAFMSTGTQMLSNRVSGSEEAGLYIGDSPNANATLASNDSSNNTLGIFVRDAQHVSILGNSVHGNCAGILFLADAPGPDGNANVNGNQITDNTKVCPPSEESTDTISGIGIGISGAHDVSLRGNIIKGNSPGPGGEATRFSGGVVIVTGDGGTPPMNNTVLGNVIRNNTPDVFWDNTGSGNTIKANVCSTSTPAGLC